MIRPITCVALLFACGSGLYLYQVKHRVHVVDTQIEQVVRQAAQVRDQIRLLRAEWTLLDQPDRLQQLAGQFLDLQPTKPTQFASLADLDARLPPVPSPEPASGPLEEHPVADAPAPAAPVAATPPPTPKREPASVAVVAPPAPVRGADHPPASAPETAHSPSAAPHGVPAPQVSRAQVATAQPPRLARSEPPAPTPRLLTAALPRPMPASTPSPVFRPVTAAPRASAPPPRAYEGSLLGMARGAAPPPPAPAPVWFNWNNR